MISFLFVVDLFHPSFAFAPVLCLHAFPPSFAPFFVFVGLFDRICVHTVDRI